MGVSHAGADGTRHAGPGGAFPCARCEAADGASAGLALARLGSGDLTDAELRAGFLAARELGKILQDDVIAAVVAAVASA